MEQVIVLCSVGFCIVEGELQTHVGNIQRQAAMWLNNNYCITYSAALHVAIVYVTMSQYKAKLIARKMAILHCHMSGLRNTIYKIQTHWNLLSESKLEEHLYC